MRNMKNITIKRILFYDIVASMIYTVITLIFNKSILQSNISNIFENLAITILPFFVTYFLISYLIVKIQNKQK